MSPRAVTKRSKSVVELKFPRAVSHKYKMRATVNEALLLRGRSVDKWHFAVFWQSFRADLSLKKMAAAESQIFLLLY